MAVRPDGISKNSGVVSGSKMYSNSCAGVASAFDKETRVSTLGFSFSRALVKENGRLLINYAKDFSDVVVASPMVIADGHDVFFNHVTDPGDIIWQRTEGQVGRIWTDTNGLHLSGTIGSNMSGILIRPDGYTQMGTITSASSKMFTSNGWAKAMELGLGYTIMWERGNSSQAFGIGASGNTFYFATSPTDNNADPAHYPLTYNYGTPNHETLRLNSANQALELGPGDATDAIWLAFFGNPTDPAARSGYVGYGSGTSSLNLVNEKPNGNIRVITSGSGKFLVNGKELGIVPITGSFSTQPTRTDSGPAGSMRQTAIRYWEDHSATNTAFSVSSGSFSYPGIVCAQRGLYAITGYVEFNPVNGYAAGRRAVDLQIQTSQILGFQFYTTVCKNEIQAEEGRISVQPVAATVVVEAGAIIRLNLSLSDASGSPDPLDYTAYLTVVRIVEL